MGDPLPRAMPPLSSLSHSQLFTALSRGSMAAFPVRRASSSSGSRAWWTGEYGAGIRWSHGCTGEGEPGSGLLPGVLGHLAISSGSLFLVRESQRNPQGFVLSLCHLQKVKHYLILPVSGFSCIPHPPGHHKKESPQSPCTCCPPLPPSRPPPTTLEPPEQIPFYSEQKAEASALEGSPTSTGPSLNLSSHPQSEEQGRLYFSMDDGHTRFTDLLQLVEFHQLNRGILPCLLRHCCTRVAL